MSSAPDPPPAATVEHITPEQCFKVFNDFIEGEKPGLKLFYPKDKLDAASVIGAAMVNHLRDEGCGAEASKQLSILTLYDIVMLIDDSSSMKDDQKGERIETLRATMKEITKIYDRANPTGILSIKFFNTRAGKKNINNKKVDGVLKGHQFFGVTKIGSMLDKRILSKFVWGGPMTKPLLVMIITDGAIEGEAPDLLERVIATCITKCSEDTTRGEDAIAFHFSRVGDDLGAATLLEKLDKSGGKHVDCLPVDKRLEDLKEPVEKWNLLRKLLVGALISHLNDDDDIQELDVQADAPAMPQDDDSDQEVEEDD